MLNNKLLFFLAIAWTGLITYLSLATIDSSLANTIEIPNKDKIVHFAFYFMFVLLWSISGNYKTYNNKLGVLILVVGILYGILMEFLQGVWTDYRTPDIYDVVANSAGAIIGWFVSKKIFAK